MNRFLIPLMLAMAVSLDSCLSPSESISTQPVNSTPVETSSPAPTDTPTEAPVEMTDKYKNQFETFEYGVKQVNGVETNVIYGIKSDETKLVT